VRGCTLFGQTRLAAVVLPAILAAQLCAHSDYPSDNPAGEGAAAAGAPAPSPSPTPAPAARSDWQVIVYPVFGFAPIFVSSASYPTIDFPNLPGGGNGTASGSTGLSLNSAAFAGVRIEKRKWVVSAAFEYAGLGGSRTSPRIDVGLDFTYGQLLAGREVLPDLWLEGGFRRIGAKISVDLLNLPDLSAKPAVWDPLIGASYRKHLGKKWVLQAHVDGGGFGVGADQDISGALTAEWRFTKRFGLSFGAEALHLAIAPEVRSRVLDLSTTIWGPVFGFGIYFGH